MCGKNEKIDKDFSCYNVWLHLGMVSPCKAPRTRDHVSYPFWNNLCSSLLICKFLNRHVTILLKTLICSLYLLITTASILYNYIQTDLKTESRCLAMSLLMSPTLTVSTHLIRYNQTFGETMQASVCLNKPFFHF